MSTTDRRTVLKQMGLGAGAAIMAPHLVAGCGSDGAKELGITTIVTVCMENRSYDHFLGARSLLEGKPGDGLIADMANPLPNGPVSVFRDDEPCVEDPPHMWEDCLAQRNDGKNDGFASVYAAAWPGVSQHAMGYLTRAELPVIYAMADAGTVCDRWFCSVLGPTWPNRMYMLSGQSGGIKSNMLPDGKQLTWPTIFNRLDEAKIAWRYYFSDLPFTSIWSNLDAESIKPVENAFLKDAKAGRLPPVVFIDPGFNYNDDHPPHHPMLGQKFLARIYNALAASPQWNNILFLVTYDEHGGFFDHVPPPTATDARAADGFGQLGFRVPTIALGPYVKAGAVSSAVFEHTSILRHIENMFGLEPLTMRDAAARDLTDLLDGDRLAALDPAPPVMLPEVTFDESTLPARCQQAAE